MVRLAEWDVHAVLAITKRRISGAPVEQYPLWVIKCALLGVKRTNIVARSHSARPLSKAGLLAWCAARLY